MTVEIEYDLGATVVNGLGEWQVKMAKQIESNRSFPITDIERELAGSAFIVRVETETLPSQTVENMLSDIEDYLPDTATHVETRGIE
jgi:hypothetical protein